MASLSRVDGVDGDGRVSLIDGVNAKVGRRRIPEMAGRPLIGRATCRAQTAARAARWQVADAQVGICACRAWTRASTRAWTTDGGWSGAIVESTDGPGGTAMSVTKPAQAVPS